MTEIAQTNIYIYIYIYVYTYIYTYIYIYIYIVYNGINNNYVLQLKFHVL